MDNENFLYDAIKSQDLNIIKRILTQIVCIDEWDDFPMSLAIQTGIIDIVRVLIEFGYKLNHDCFIGGLSPLGRAIEKNKSIDFIRELISLGADPNYPGITDCLALAVRRKDVEIIKELILAGVSINSQSESGYTPLMQAVLDNQFNLVEILLNNGADPNLITNYRENAYSLALEYGFKKIAALIKLSPASL
jgi:uncharacterized protein